MNLLPANDAPHIHSILKDDIRGVVAVEFALLLPFMFAIYLGVSEMSQAVRASQKVDQIAHFIADITARKTTGGLQENQGGITVYDLIDIFNAADMLIAPLPREGLLIEIDEIKTGSADKAVKPKVMWLVQYNPSGRASYKRKHRQCGFLDPGSADEFKNMPEGIAYSQNPDGYLIAARVQYDYGTSGLQYLAGRALSMTRWSYAVPRATPSTLVSNPLLLRMTTVNTDYPYIVPYPCNN